MSWWWSWSWSCATIQLAHPESSGPTLGSVPVSAPLGLHVQLERVREKTHFTAKKPTHRRLAAIRRNMSQRLRDPQPSMTADDLLFHKNPSCKRLPRAEQLHDFLRDQWHDLLSGVTHNQNDLHVLHDLWCLHTTICSRATCTAESTPNTIICGAGTPRSAPHPVRAASPPRTP